MKNPFKEIFLSVVKNALDKQRQDGSMEAGHNGPYYDLETPVRNTSHWIISFSKAYNLTGEREYYNAAERSLEYLYNNQKFRNGYTYLHRQKIGKDSVNGVIGPAWNIEALVEGFNLIGDKKYLNLAIELFNLHPFDEKVGLWKRRMFDGKIGNFDFTFNHQLWFCAAGNLIAKYSNDELINRKVTIFFNNLSKNLRVHSSGLIRHAIRDRTTNRARLINILRPLYGMYLKQVKGKDLKYKEEGYHMFNLYAFALIKELGFENHFFNTVFFCKMVDLAFDYKLINNLMVNRDYSDLSHLKNNNRININRYGYGYNAPGFELPYIQKVLRPNKTEISEIIFEQQLELTYDKAHCEFNANTDDPITLTARVYELARFL